VALAFKRQGKRVCVLAGLEFEHEWGVSASSGTRVIEWLGGRESIEAINLRNRARLVRKWGAQPVSAAFDGRYYSEDYFARGQYVETMTRPRVVNGRAEPPLVETMGDVLEASGLLPAGGRLLDVGCSYGFLVAELLRRGYDAYGLDFSSEVIAQSPVRERLWAGNALEMPLDTRYDVVFAGDIYEHLNDAEARALTLRIGSVSDRLLAIINKSRHEPSHVNIKSNRQWIRLLGECGFGLETLATWRGRARYLQRSAGTECWHLNFLALSKHAHASWRRLAGRLGSDAPLAWRVAGEIAKRRR
jgi:SAM-dependent methyltransferase